MITYNRELCVGCNACIRTCPAPEANETHLGEDGSISISINSDKCINCGSCIKVCDHNARGFVDDTEDFWEDLKNGVPITVIVTPSIKIAYDGNWRNVLLYLRKKGVKKIYDVSLGADICTWAHLRYLERNPGKKLISQPCAAIVNYILKYKKQLVDVLSPVHSPILCTAIYARKYLNCTDRIAVLSPCIAKKEEFNDTGLVTYNVTYKNFKEIMNRHEKSIMDIELPVTDNSYSSFEFDDQQGIVGSVYPRPGGLKYNLLLRNKDLNIINSEGVNRVYNDLNNYSLDDATNHPDVFDVLSCECGCNSGPAVGQDYSVFKMESIMNNVESYSVRHRMKVRFGKDVQYSKFDKRLDIQDFIREYTPDISRSKEPTKMEIEQAFKLLGKRTNIEKKFNCHSCGYKTCEAMAIAICKNISIPANCSQYTKMMAEANHKKVESINQEIALISSNLNSVMSTLISSISYVGSDTKKIGELGENNRVEMDELKSNLQSLIKLCGNVVEATSNITGSIQNYVRMIGDI